MALTHALLVTRHGGSEVLQVADTDVAGPGPGELLVAVEAVGVNFIDIYLREGIYPGTTPYVAASEGAGTVVATGGPDTTGQGLSDQGVAGQGVPGPGVAGAAFGVGQRVAWARAAGSAAGLALVPAAGAALIPEPVPTEVAAAAMLQGMTAHYLVNSTYPVQPGDWALVHAAAGGVGQLLVQLIRARGGHVIGTVSSAAKAAIATALGADHIINYSQVSDLAAAVRDLTGGVGVAVVYDGVGKTTFDASLASLKPRGMMALFGGASGQVPPFDIQRLNRAGSLFLTRPTLDSYLQTPAEFAERSSSILNSIAAGELAVEIGGRYPLQQAAQAYDDLQARRTTGKLLLIP